MVPDQASPFGLIHRTNRRSAFPADYEYVEFLEAGQGAMRASPGSNPKISNSSNYHNHDHFNKWHKHFQEPNTKSTFSPQDAALEASNRTNGYASLNRFLVLGGGPHVGTPRLTLPLPLTAAPDTAALPDLYVALLRLDQGV